MLNFIDSSDQVLAFELIGKLNEQDMQSLQQALESKVAAKTTLNMLCDLSSLEDLSSQALVEGAKTDMEFLTHLNQFQRLAFISNKSWPEALISLIAPFMPGIEIRVFSSDERDSAIEWCNVISEPSSGPVKTERHDAITIITTNIDNALGIEVNGKVTPAGLPEALAKIQSVLDQHDSINLLTHIKDFGGFSPSIFMQHGLFSMKIAAIHKVKRYAIVGAPSWMGTAIKVMNPLFSQIDMKLFKEHELDQAWQWIGAHPV